MATGDITPRWGSWNTVTQTNLDGLASSPTHVAGWEGAEIDLTGFLDAEMDFTFQVESTGLSAGEIRVWLVKRHNGTIYPDVFDGTESAETVTDTEIRDAICRLAAFTVTDTTASRTYYVQVDSFRAVFGGNLPEKVVPFVTQSTGAALETTGDPNQGFWRGHLDNVAAT